MEIPIEARPATTIAVVPRQTFTHTMQTLRSIGDDLTAGTRVVCIDAGSPRRIARELAAVARDHDYALVRTEHFLSPNQARNLALRYVDTEFVAFVDNDVLVQPGWLTALEECARETGAWIVGPVYFIDDRSGYRVHHAGGNSHLEGPDRTLVDTHEYQDVEPSRLPSLRRGPTEQVEFHCMLVRRAVFEQLGPLDESLPSTLEANDLCMSVTEANGGVWQEPAASVTYTVPRFVSGIDRRYWILRWSDQWAIESLQRFCQKWELSADDPVIEGRIAWHRTNRRYAYRPYASPLNRAPKGIGRPLVDVVDRAAQQRVLAWHGAALAKSGPPRLVHAPAWVEAMQTMV